MIKELAKSIREYKRPSILAPVYVIGEVVMEAVIPFIIAKMVNQIKAGATVAIIWEYGGVLLALAMRALDSPAMRSTSSWVCFSLARPVARLVMQQMPSTRMPR